MAVLARETLSKKPLQPLYVVHGDEELLSIEAVDSLRQLAKEQGFEDRQVFTADTGFNWQTVLDSVLSIGLFSSKKFIQINIPSGKPGVQGADVLQQLAGMLSDDVVVLVYLAGLERSQQQSKWFKNLVQNACVLENRSVSKDALPHWLEQRLQQYDLSIDPDALALFSQRVEGNLLAAKQEIDKLGLLFTPGTRLTLDDIQQCIASLARFDVFQIAESWMNADSVRMSRLLDGLEQDEDTPVLLLWAVSEDIRALLKLRAGLAQGKNISALAGPLRLWGEKKILAPKALKRIGARKLLAALQTCARVDRQIKGAEEGFPWQTLRFLLLDLCGGSK